MPDTITAHFDGKVIVPDAPLNVSAGQRLRVQFEPIEEEYPLRAIANMATDRGVTDLAERHQHYARTASKERDGG